MGCQVCAASPEGEGGHRGSYPIPSKSFLCALRFILDITRGKGESGARAMSCLIQRCGVLRAASQAIWRMTFPLTMYTTISAMLVAWSAMRSRYFAI